MSMTMMVAILVNMFNRTFDHLSPPSRPGDDYRLWTQTPIPDQQRLAFALGLGLRLGLMCILAIFHM
jgi:hypothetical protein